MSQTLPIQGPIFYLRWRPENLEGSASEILARTRYAYLPGRFAERFSKFYSTRELTRPESVLEKTPYMTHHIFEGKTKAEPNLYLSPGRLVVKNMVIGPFSRYQQRCSEAYALMCEHKDADQWRMLDARLLYIREMQIPEGIEPLHFMNQQLNVGVKYNVPLVVPGFGRTSLKFEYPTREKQNTVKVAVSLETDEEDGSVYLYWEGEVFYDADLLEKVIWWPEERFKRWLGEGHGMLVECFDGFCKKIRTN